jgi:hypothetical protein
MYSFAEYQEVVGVHHYNRIYLYFNYHVIIGY